jgi:hypothetical protein
LNWIELNFQPTKNEFRLVEDKAPLTFAEALRFVAPNPSRSQAIGAFASLLAGCSGAAPRLRAIQRGSGGLRFADIDIIVWHGKGVAQTASQWRCVDWQGQKNRLKENIINAKIKK